MTYNRYIRNERGDYVRVPVAAPPPPPRREPPRVPPPPPPDATRFLGRILERMRLQDVDTGDLLLLVILFFLFEEKADDELLIALGLLLIL